MVDEDPTVNSDDPLSAYDAIGDAFGIEIHDPLLEFDEQFKSIEQKPLQIYKKSIERENTSRKWRNNKKSIIDSWEEHMSDFPRHPACPNIRHAGDYINKQLDKDIKSKRIKEKLRILSDMFDYWAANDRMPHGKGEAIGYHPINSALEMKEDEIDAIEKPEKNQHQMTIEELGHQIRQIKNILHRAVIATQFKFGVRSGQLTNVKLSEIKIDHSGLNELYPELGTHTRFRDIEEDAIYFVPTDVRAGGKSKRPIVMPIDHELRRILIRYLRQRPPIDESWLFVNNSTGNQLNTDYLTRSIWKPAFHPKYSETDEFIGVTSHYGRHRFTTYWKKEIGIKPEYVQYMRGDKQDKSLNGGYDILENYVHTYYSDIKDIYLSNIYKFGI